MTHTNGHPGAASEGGDVGHSGADSGRTHSPACRVDGHGRRCIADRYETVLLHESGPSEWSLNLHPNGLEWSVLVDLADAIKQAQAEGVSE